MISFIISLLVSFFLILIPLSFTIDTDDTESSGFTAFLLFIAFPILTYVLFKFFNQDTINSIKPRAIKSLEEELSTLIHEDIKLVASAYRNTISSNSFGKKNYSKFKKELIEYLLDHTSSKDVIHYASELGDFDIPDHTISEIERAISDYSEEEKFSNSMDPYEYEHYCANQFLQNGWDEAEATSGSSDQGVDVIAKRGEEHLVGQCKKYQKPVGNSAVQEVVAGMGYYGANVGVVISNAGFTTSAKKLAEANNIKLIHHSEIKNL